MNKILKSAFLYFNKIKVVHSIPGRLRLQIPGLNKVPDNMKKYEKYTTNIIKLQDGINDISYSYITGKILITYDINKTNEKKIVEWLNVVWKKIVDNEAVYKDMTADEIENNSEKFYTMLYDELKKGM